MRGLKQGNAQRLLGLFILAGVLYYMTLLITFARFFP